MEKIQIGSWDFDPGTRQLSSGEDATRLTPKAAQVLEELARRGTGRVVSRAELLDTVWPKAFVVEEVLTHAISELRKAFGDDPKRSKYIETIPKAGYRLNVPVRSRSVTSAEAPSGPSVAILKLGPTEPTPQWAHLRRGLVDEVVRGLSSRTRLRVVSLVEATDVTQVFPDIAAIARAFDVDYVLSGTLDCDGESLSVRIELHAPSSTEPSPVEAFEGPLTSLLALQAEVIEWVASALGLDAGRPTPWAESVLDSDNLELYLRGRHRFHLGGRLNNEQAIGIFERCLETDPDNALVHAALSDCYVFAWLYYHPAGQALSLSERHSTLALSQAPTLGEALTARGLVHSLMERDDEARESFEDALRSDPWSFEVHYLYGRYSLSVGDMERAVDLFGLAANLRPDHFHTHYLRGKCLRGLGEHEAAGKAYARARDSGERWLRLSPDGVRPVVVRACCMIELGQIRDGLDALDDLLARQKWAPMHYYVACGLARAGEVERAIIVLRKIVEVGWSHLPWLLNDPDLDHVRASGAFDPIKESVERRWVGRA